MPLVFKVRVLKFSATLLFDMSLKCHKCELL